MHENFPTFVLNNLKVNKKFVRKYFPTNTDNSLQTDKFIEATGVYKCKTKDEAM